MAYGLVFTLALGAGRTGLASTLRAQRVDTSGADTGSVISTGFVEDGTSGNYLFFTSAIPDGFQGSVRFYDTGAPSTSLGLAAINPTETENADVKTSTRAAAGDAMDLVANAVDAAALAADAVTEIQSGLATAANVAAVETDTQDIQGRLPAVLVSGRIDASVGAMAANVMTAAAAAADLTTELQSGLATAADLATVAGYVDTEVAAIKAKTDNLPASPAAVGSEMTLADGAITAAKIADNAIDAAALAADVGTEIVAAFLAAAVTAPTAPPTAPYTVDDVLGWVLGVTKFKRTQSSTTDTILQDDGVTTLGTSTTSDSGGVFTRTEYV